MPLDVDVIQRQRIEAYELVRELEDQLEIQQRQLAASRKCCSSANGRVTQLSRVNERLVQENKLLKKQLNSAILELAVPKTDRRKLSDDQWVTLLGGQISEVRLAESDL